MRKILEMITVLRMQNMVEIRKKNSYFVTKSLFEKYWEKTWTENRKLENLGIKLSQLWYINKKSCKKNRSSKTNSNQSKINQSINIYIHIYIYTFVLRLYFSPIPEGVESDGWAQRDVGWHFGKETSLAAVSSIGQSAVLAPGGCSVPALGFWQRRNPSAHYGILTKKL